MRVFLPLKISLPNKQSSCESLVDLEYSEEAAASENNNHFYFEESEPHSQQELGVAPELLKSLASSTGRSSQAEAFPAAAGECDLERKHPSALQEGVAVAASLKTTGLASQDSVGGDRKRSAASPRKRPRASLEDSQKRPAVEQKPPAKPSLKMGLPNRKPVSTNHSWQSGGRALVTRNNKASHSMETDDSAPENQPVGLDSSIDDSPFALELKKCGLEIQEQDGDGNCLFRAVSLQVYGDPSMHELVRKQCMDFMVSMTHKVALEFGNILNLFAKERDKEHFCQFVTGEDFAMYVNRKRQDGVHGNNPEIQAISELFNRPIEVFSPDNGARPLNILHAEYKTDDAPIRLSYHDGNHYNAVIDPLVPTAGLGLGLPGLQPGLADKMQMAKAVAESDATADQMELQRALQESQDDELQRALKESQLSTEHMRSHQAIAQSDVDATYFEIEQAALEHSLEYYRQQEHGKKQRASQPQDDDRKSNCSSAGITDDLTPQFLTEESSPASSQPLSVVASLPTSSANVANEARIPDPAVPVAASISSVASVASANNFDDLELEAMRSVDEYPPVVQEMVMNGFPLPKVVRAVELIGENFDDLLAMLMSSAT